MWVCFPRGAQLPQNGEPVDAGEHQVEHDRVIVVEQAVIEPVHTIGGEIDGVAHLPQAAAQRAEQALGVLDDEQLHGFEPGCSGNLASHP